MKIVKIETNSEELEHLFDIEVPSVHEYLLANGNVVHNSSKSIGMTNSVYPVRDKTLIKTDGGITVRWAAPNSDDKEYHYQSAWDINEVDMIKVYAVMQKFIDQTISADLWRRIKNDDTVSSRELIIQYLTMYKYGMKTRYYYNSNVSSGISLTSNTPSIPEVPQREDPADCDGCSL